MPGEAKAPEISSGCGVRSLWNEYRVKKQEDLEKKWPEHRYQGRTRKAGFSSGKRTLYGRQSWQACRAPP